MRLIAIMLALWAAAAAAQEPGFYAGASVGGSSSNTCDLDLGTTCDESATNLKVFAGYQFNRNLAVEAGYMNTLAKSTVSTTTGLFGPPTSTSTADLAARAFDVLLVPSLPIGERASLYAKLGAYFAHTEAHTTTAPAGQPPVTTHSDESNTGLTYGVGFAWRFTRAVTARVDWQRYDGVGGGQSSDVNVDVLHIGALYRF